MALGWLRERDGEELEERERDPKKEGVRGRLRGAGREPQGREAGREEVAASARAVPAFASAYWQRLKTTGTSQVGWAGWRSWATTVPGQVGFAR